MPTKGIADYAKEAAEKAPRTDGDNAKAIIPDYVSVREGVGDDFVEIIIKTKKGYYKLWSHPKEGLKVNLQKDNSHLRGILPRDKLKDLTKALDDMKV
jgi:hypothetical protein